MLNGDPLSGGLVTGGQPFVPDIAPIAPVADRVSLTHGCLTELHRHRLLQINVIESACRGVIRT